MARGLDWEPVIISHKDVKKKNINTVTVCDEGGRETSFIFLSHIKKQFIFFPEIQSCKNLLEVNWVMGLMSKHGQNVNTANAASTNQFVFHWLDWIACSVKILYVLIRVTSLFTVYCYNMCCQWIWQRVGLSWADWFAYIVPWKVHVPIR